MKNYDDVLLHDLMKDQYIYYVVDEDDNALSHHGVLGMKWGVRKHKGPVGRQAVSIYEEASKHEPKITSDFEETVNNVGGSVYGLEHKLKTIESIARKVRLGKDIKDALRYTAIFSEEDFVKSYIQFKKDITEKGYDETTCKNYFEDYRQGKVNHKSVQCNYRTNDGYTFEVQFQTKASQRAKDEKVPLYEEARNPKTSDARKEELIVQMRALADNVVDPPGISKIKPH